MGKVKFYGIVCALSASMLVQAGPVKAAEMGTEVTYQGNLTDGGGPVTGQVDMLFTLFDAATLGNQVGTTAVFDGQGGNGAQVDVADGLLTVSPDFGSNVYDGTALWLEVQVRNPHDPTDMAPYDPLDPLQPLTAVPVALQTRGIFVEEPSGNVVFALLEEALDQAQEGQSGAGNLGAIWQSFTAGESGWLSKAEYFVLSASATEGTLEVYTGEGTSGTLLATESYSLSGASSEWISIPLNTPPLVESGQVYTLRFVPTDGSHTLGIAFGDAYPGGVFFVNPADWDLQFRTFVQPIGKVGIGTASPGFTLEVSGSAGKPGGGEWSVASDIRLKKNVRDLHAALDRVLALRGVTFEFKNPSQIGQLSGEQIGLIAQEVEKVFPDWVDEGPGNYKYLTVRGATALFVEALRELREEKDAQLAQRDARIAELAARLQHIEQLLRERRPAVGGFSSSAMQAGEGEPNN